MTALDDLDLSALDDIDWAHLDFGSSGFGPVPDGKYVLQSPNTIDFDAREGKLRAILPFILIVEGSKAGSKLGKHWISTKKYSNRNASPAIEYLAACGITNLEVTSWEHYQRLLANTTGLVWQGTVQQRAYCNHKETSEASQPAFSCKGEGQMPKQADGSTPSSFKCPTCQRQVFVNSQVTRFHARAGA